METQNQNTEGTKKPNAEQPEWMKGDIGKILSGLNQPGIASALAGLGLYFAIDPKAIKTSLDQLIESNNKLADLVGELVEENAKIKKQLKKLINREEENEVGDGQLNGYRKAGARSRTIFLD